MSDHGTPAKGVKRTATAFGIATAAALGLAVTYAAGGQVQIEGALLALALGGIGFGLVLFARSFLPGDEVSEDRGALESSDEERDAFAADFEKGQEPMQRRSFLVRMAGAAVGALGLAALFPIRSLGPNPGRSLFRTGFRRGARLVTAEGRLVRVGDVSAGGIVTVFPEGEVGRADSQTLLIHLANPENLRPRPGREDWSPEGHVAYSKICTHAGCPVGLYQADAELLLCPCHQSTFDVLDGCRPTFGPATRSLPQLPIGVDGEGYFVAMGDYPSPVGPGFWDMDRDG